MYAGIHISNTFICAAITDENGKTILVTDESIEHDKKFINPLKMYIEDEFAYLGDKVNYLLANNYDLNYASGFLENPEASDTPVYKDGSGQHWNVAALIAIFLKKLKTDILIHNDTPIKSAAVTLSVASTPALTESLYQAFDMVGIPLAAILPVEKAALEGYAITNTENKTQHLFFYYLSPDGVTASISTFNEEDTVEVVHSATEKELGEQRLREKFRHFLEERYEHTTGKKIKETPKNLATLTRLTDELIAYAVSGVRLYTPLVCAIDDEIIELIITKEQLSSLLEEYTNATLSFLKEELLHTAGCDAETIAMIVMTGNSALLPLIEQQLKPLFPGEHQTIYNRKPEEVLTKGAAAYAGNIGAFATETLPPVETPSGEEDLQKKEKETVDPQEPKIKPDTNTLKKRIRAIHINAGSETM